MLVFINCVGVFGVVGIKLFYVFCVVILQKVGVMKGVVGVLVVYFILIFVYGVKGEGRVFKGD